MGLRAYSGTSLIRKPLRRNLQQPYAYSSPMPLRICLGFMLSKRSVLKMFETVTQPCFRNWGLCVGVWGFYMLGLEAFICWGLGLSCVGVLGFHVLGFRAFMCWCLGL